MKSRIAIVLSLVMLLSLLAACTKSNGGNGTEPSASAPASDPAATDSTKYVPEDEIEEYTIYWNDTQMPNFDNWESPVAEEITKRTGVKLKFEFAVGDPKQKLDMMIASGDYPDMIQTKVNLTDLVNAEALIKLDDLIDQHGPNIKELFGDQFSHLKYSKADPSIYTFGYGAAVNDTTPGPNWNTGYQLQIDALKAQGYPEIKSLADWENVIRAELKNNPKTEDGKDKIGITLVTSDNFRYIFSVLNPAATATGLSDDGEFHVDPATGIATLHFFRPEEKEYMRWLNKLYNEGLIDKESFTQSFDTYISKLASGRVVGMIDSMWQYQPAVQKLKEAKQFDKTWIPFPALQDPSTQEWKWYAGNSTVSSSGIAITKKAKNPEKLVKFFDFLASEEGNILTEWGIEGVHYDIVDGQRVLKPDVKDLLVTNPQKMQQTEGLTLYAGGYGSWISRGYGVKDSNGQLIRNIDVQSNIDAYSAEEKEAFAAYNITTPMDLVKPASAFPAREYPSLSSMNTGYDEEAKVIWQKYNDLKWKEIVHSITTTPDQFDAVWDKWIQDAKDLGIQKIIDNVNIQMNDYKALWASE